MVKKGAVGGHFSSVPLWGGEGGLEGSPCLTFTLFNSLLPPLPHPPPHPILRRTGEGGGGREA